jgi:hypothetical protein
MPTDHFPLQQTNGARFVLFCVLERVFIYHHNARMHRTGPRVVS